MSRPAVVALALAAALAWGLWWAPVRAIEAAGLDGLTASLLMALGTLPPLAWAARGAPRPSARAAAGALVAGAAVALYAVALAWTDVVRAVLLFYLAPAWSTAIECLFLGRKWSGRSALALGLSALGVAAIFRFEVSGGAWRAGDLAALASGAAWSLGAALVFVAPDAAGGRAFASLGLRCGLGASVAAAVALAAGGAGPWPADALRAVAAGALGLATGAVYLAPILLVTMAAALRLPPATMSFLLTAEILSGVVSSALWLGEPFGPVEALGAALVAAGALVETTAPPLKDAARPA